jgi:hypothetical protein
MLAVGLQCMACVGVFKPLLGVNVSIHMFFFCILSNVNNRSIIQMSSSINLEGFPNAPPMQSQNILERTHEVLQYPYNDAYDDAYDDVQLHDSSPLSDYQEPPRIDHLQRIAHLDDNERMRRDNIAASNAQSAARSAVRSAVRYANFKGRGQPGGSKSKRKNRRITRRKKTRKHARK